MVILWFAFLPQFLSRYQVITFSNYMISALLALSLCLIWGYCGILSLGQAAFFGIGGYAYGIVALNLLRYQGNTDIAFLAGVIAPMVFAAVIGVIMFFARLQGVYVAILTLVISLLLGTFMRQTADPSYTIGAAYLGGMNGLRPASPNDPLLPSLIFGLRDWVLGARRAQRRFLLFHALRSSSHLPRLPLARELELRLPSDRLSRGHRTH